ncbi:glycosyltransferase family 2 protein [Pseudooceanicola marinus]|uniref:glycosyltransferase family 2 protein n=1 Tax=Pseudooceanicola marinus TaxID=396013 RepID=UPI001CD47960|nr:glycosyltransferase family 2 protein [Pseudooceanicola marinus]MCA1335349.1 glycosyltransferase family 2 protein [Pseudooceanicola marinus]
MSDSWAVVATAKAPVEEVLSFAAWHLELGVARLHIYLDDPQDPVYPILKAHPKIRAVQCDDRYWRRVARNGCPDKHQMRQTLNASHCYNAKNRHDWLAHIDVDEFLLPDRPVTEILAALPPAVLSARMRPMEVLARPEGPDAEGPVHLRAFSLALAQRHAETERVYPEFGAYLNGGMLSHVAGKLFVRKGLPDVRFRIHRVLSAGEADPGQQELPEIPVAHFHATSWSDWQSHYRFRLDRGAYRAELKPSRRADAGSVNLHSLLSTLEDSEGETGLRRFFDEVCADTPALRDRLAAEGLLREVTTDFAALRARHFPDVGA